MNARRLFLVAVALVGAACSDEIVPPPSDGAAPRSDAQVTGDAPIDKDASQADDTSSTRDASSVGDAGALVDASIAVPLDAILALPDPAAPLAAQSPSCLDCAVANCGNYMEGCATLAGAATSGPAAGMPRAQLCVDTLSCVLSTNCAACLDPSSGCIPLAQLGTCYCQWDNPIVETAPQQFCDPPVRFSGPCKAVLEGSLETTATSAVLGSFSDSTSGGGWALQLLQCLVDNRCASCFPPPLDASSDANEGGGDD
jgi:hypothetical protein